MARKKLYYRYEIPTSIVSIGKAICADYDRRERVISRAASETNEVSSSDPVIDRLSELNAIVDEALVEIEEELRRIMLDDILTGRGYEFSQATTIVSRGAYYRRKRKLIYDIAKGLRLF